MMKLTSLLNFLIVTFALMLLPQNISAQWIDWEECLYVSEPGLHIDYSYSMSDDCKDAVFPLGFGYKVIVPIIWSGEMGLSTGEIFGGNHKTRHFITETENLKKDIVSKFYWMKTLGVETGIASLQVGLGLCVAEEKTTGKTHLNTDGIYETEINFTKKALFMIEPAIHLYIPIYDVHGLSLKCGYQFVPSEPILNALVVGGGVSIDLF